MAYSNVAATIFTIRNADKTTSGDIGRLPVTVGQAATTLKAAAQQKNSVSKALSKGLKLLNNDKVVQKVGKVVNFASENVNPLIVASSGLKVVCANKEDRKKTLITEAGCITGMFIGEGAMKKHLDKALEKLPIDKKWIPIIKGIVFVSGSIASSTIGQKIGEKVAKYWDTPLDKNITAQKGTDNSAQNIYTPMKYQA